MLQQGTKPSPKKKDGKGKVEKKQQEAKFRIKYEPFEVSIPGHGIATYDAPILEILPGVKIDKDA